jgi:hypothetical protein
MKINYIVNLIVVYFSILSIITISGCSYSTNTKAEFNTDNTTSFADHFVCSYNNNEGVYHVKGSITNKGIATAQNISVTLSFTNINGYVLHQKRMQIGNINPSEEKSVSYDWAGPKGANFDTKVYQDTKQVPLDNKTSNYSEDSEIKWGD